MHDSTAVFSKNISAFKKLILNYSNDKRRTKLLSLMPGHLASTKYLAIELPHVWKHFQCCPPANKKMQVSWVLFGTHSSGLNGIRTDPKSHRRMRLQKNLLS